MSIEYIFRPLTSWPGKRRTNRKRATFSAGYGRTLIDLEREVWHLGARQCVIEAECAESEIRDDGRLRSNARLSGPGLIVSFVGKTGALRFPCDSYTDWQANLRAIALALAALRAVDRYGVTQHAEQYKGWKQLPPGGDRPEAIQMEAFASVEDAMVFLSVTGKTATTRDPAHVDAVYRRAATFAHPDQGGSSELMSKVNAARDYIEKYGTVAA